MIPEMVWAFLTGLAGSLHCLGMCGPLVVAYSLHLQPEGTVAATIPHNPWSSGLTHHLIFHLGRISTYGLLGALGAGLVQAGGLWESILSVRTVATLTGGVLMVLFGLVLLKVIPFSFTAVSSSRQDEPVLSRLIRTSFSSRSLGSKGVLGFAVGFLPCMLSWAMIIKAAATGNPVMGFLSMVLFGLGTVPVLFFTGFSASIFSFRIRLAGERVAAISVLVMGIILLLKGATHLA